MTEKRFTQNMTHYGTSQNYVTGINDNQTNRELVDIADVVGLLNMLHEENTELRTALKELQEIGDYQADRIAELDNENIKLEDQLKNLRRLANEVYMEQNE